MAITDDSVAYGIVPMYPKGARSTKRLLRSDRKRRIKRKTLEERIKTENAFDKRTVTCLLDSDGEIIVRTGFDLSDAFAGVIGKKATTSKKSRAEARFSELERHRRCALVAESLNRLIRRREVYHTRELIDGEMLDVYYLVSDS